MLFSNIPTTSRSEKTSVNANSPNGTVQASKLNSKQEKSSSIEGNKNSEGTSQKLENEEENNNVESVVKQQNENEHPNQSNNELIIPVETQE